MDLSSGIRKQTLDIFISHHFSQTRSRKVLRNISAKARVPDRSANVTGIQTVTSGPQASSSRIAGASGSSSSRPVASSSTGHAERIKVSSSPAPSPRHSPEIIDLTDDASEAEVVNLVRPPRLRFHPDPQPRTTAAPTRVDPIASFLSGIMAGLEAWVPLLKNEGINNDAYLDALARYCEPADLREMMRRMQRENAGVATPAQAAIIAGAILKRRAAS